MVTRAAALTAPGRGAVAVIRIWGARAIEVADAVFVPHRGKRLADTPPNRPRVGRVGGDRGDEVVALVDPPEVEIQCHGGPAAVELVLSTLARAGAVRSHPYRWIRCRASGRIAAEAEFELARATTARTAEILLDQAGGALDRRLAEIAEMSAADRRAASDALLGRAKLGLKLVSGFRIALAGRPNVGKSSLLNALVGYKRAIVDSEPGTTRDVVTASTAFEGWPVEIADTAGLRSTGDAIEAEGVALARERHRDADLVLLVLAVDVPQSEEDLRWIERHPDALRVANRVDLPRAWEPEEFGVSALRGDGIEDLVRLVASRLVPDPPAPGEAVPFRRRHLRLIERLRDG